VDFLVGSDDGGKVRTMKWWVRLWFVVIEKKGYC